MVVAGALAALLAVLEALALRGLVVDGSSARALRDFAEILAKLCARVLPISLALLLLAAPLGPLVVARLRRHGLARQVLVAASTALALTWLVSVLALALQGIHPGARVLALLAAFFVAASVLVALALRLADAIAGGR